jgi:hypothetical protein
MKHFLNSGLIRRLLTLLFGTLLLSASSTVLAAKPPQPQQIPGAQIRVIHASPDMGLIDLFLDGTRLLANTNFSALSGYLKVPVGEHQIQVAPARQGISHALITQNIILERNIFYTVATVGTRTDGFSLAAFQDESTLSQNNLAKVRIYHLSPDIGAVTISSSDKIVIKELAYKNASDYQEVPPNKYTFTISVAQLSSTTPNTALKTDTILQPGTINSVFAIGLASGQPALKFITSVVRIAIPNSIPSKRNHQ